MCADASQPVIVTTATVMSHKALDPIFKNHRAPSHCYLHNHLQDGQGLILNPMSQTGKLRPRGCDPPGVSAQAGLANRALFLAPSPCLGSAHLAQTPAGLPGMCLSLAELPGSLGKLAGPPEAAKFAYPGCPETPAWRSPHVLITSPLEAQTHLVGQPYLKACILQGRFPEGWQAVSEGNRKRRREIRWLRGHLRAPILWYRLQGLPFRTHRSCL